MTEKIDLKNEPQYIKDAIDSKLTEKEFNFFKNFSKDLYDWLSQPMNQYTDESVLEYIEHEFLHKFTYFQYEKIDVQQKGDLKSCYKIFFKKDRPHLILLFSTKKENKPILIPSDMFIITK